jgi:hypothetical protein
VALLVASFVSAVVGRSGDSHGVGIAVFGLAIGILNTYLSFIRPGLYRQRHGSFEGYRFISGVPGLGTVFIIVAGAWGFGELLTTVIGLVALALDTGGWPWFLFATWHDQSLWDG